MWTAGAFNTLPTPVYLVSLAVPVAIAAAAGLDDLLEGKGSLIPSALVLCSFAVLASSFGVVAVGAVVLALISAARRRVLGTAITFALIGVIAVLVAAPSIKPLRLRGIPAEMKQVAMMKNFDIVASGHPAYDWYSGRNTDVGAFALARAIRQAPPGSMFVADSQFTPTFLNPTAQAFLYGVQPVLKLGRKDYVVEVLVKVADAEPAAASTTSRGTP